MFSCASPSQQWKAGSRSTTGMARSTWWKGNTPWVSARWHGQLLKAVEESSLTTGIDQHWRPWAGKHRGGDSDVGRSVCPSAVSQRSSSGRHCLQTFKRTFIVLHLMPAMCRLLVRWFVTRWIQRNSFPEQDECVHLALPKSLSS